MHYRHERSMEHDAVAMAVVVQVMVPSEVSGIVFTADPASGERSEMIVNCSFGLGEAVVGGEVTPDTYVVDRDSLTAKETVTGAKERMIVADGEQGTRTEAVRAEQRGEPCLSNAVLADLAALALAVEDVFDGEPQDIEWALSSGEALAAAIPPDHEPAARPAERRDLARDSRSAVIEAASGGEHARPAVAALRRSLSAGHIRHADMARGLGMERPSYQELDEELRCDDGERLRVSAALHGASRGLGSTHAEDPRRAEGSCHGMST